MEKKWYAIYTKPNWEKKTAELLSKRQIVVYCPVQKVVKQWSDRKKTILEPLFKSYVFISVPANDFAPVVQTEGVLNFVHWLGKPAVIKDSEIEAIKTFLATYADIRIEAIPVSTKDIVIIKTGVFEGEEAEVVSAKKNFVNVFLPSLGYKLTASIGAKNIEVAKKPASSRDL